jgi:hypothetical protein
MGIIQCSTGKDKNIWDLIEKSINNNQSSLYKKINQEYYIIKDLLKPGVKKNEKKSQIQKETFSLTSRKLCFITPKNRMKFFTKWYIMSHPNQITKTKTRMHNSDSKINKKQINSNFNNSPNFSFAISNKEKIRSTTSEKNNKNNNLRKSIKTEEDKNGVNTIGINRIKFDETEIESNNSNNNNKNENDNLDRISKDRKKVYFTNDIPDGRKHSSTIYNHKLKGVKELENWKDKDKDKEKENKFKSFTNSNINITYNGLNVINNNINTNNNIINNISNNFSNIPSINKLRNSNGNFRSTNISKINIPQENNLKINTNNINNSYSKNSSSNNLMKIKIMKNEDSVKIISNLNQNINLNQSKEYKENNNNNNINNDSINKQLTLNSNFSENEMKKNSFEYSVNNTNNLNNNNISDNLHLSSRSNDQSSTTGRANGKSNYSKSKSNIMNKEELNSNNDNDNYNNNNDNDLINNINNLNKNNCTSSIENEALSNSMCQNFNIFDDSNIIESNLRLFYDIQKPKFLKRVENGPPSSFRWISWIIASEIPLERSIDYYNYLLTLPLAIDVDLQIKKDLNRTLCGITLTNSNSALDDFQLILSNTLRAFAQVDKEVSYCQGMNFIVGFLLVMSDFNQIETFYLMTSIFSNTYRNNLGIRGFFLKDFPLGNFYVEMFLFLFEKHLPELRNHFNDLCVHEEAWVSKWFRTLFTVNLPLEFVMRIWDCIFANGLEFILNFTLAFLKYMEKDLLKMNDLTEVLEYFKKLAPFYFVENEGDNKLLEENINFLQSFDLEEIIKKALKIKIDKNLVQEKMKEFEKNNKFSFEKTKIKYNMQENFENYNDNDNNYDDIYINYKDEDELKLKNKINSSSGNIGIHNEFSKIANGTLTSKNSNEIKIEKFPQNPQNLSQKNSKEYESDDSNLFNKDVNDCVENSENDSDEIKEGIDDKICSHTFKTNIKKLQENNKYK